MFVVYFYIACNIELNIFDSLGDLNQVQIDYIIVQT